MSPTGYQPIGLDLGFNPLELGLVVTDSTPLLLYSRGPDDDTAWVLLDGGKVCLKKFVLDMSYVLIYEERQAVQYPIRVRLILRRSPDDPYVTPVVRRINMRYRGPAEASKHLAFVGEAIRDIASLTSAAEARGQTINANLMSAVTEVAEGIRTNAGLDTSVAGRRPSLIFRYPPR